MAHPAFTTSEALVVKKAFEKGLNVHGEEQAIAYWNNTKETLLRPYQKNMTQVEGELNSSFFKNRGDKWKGQARELAKQDPLRLLERLEKMKGDITLNHQKQQARALEIEQEKERIQSLDRGRGGHSL